MRAILETPAKNGGHTMRTRTAALAAVSLACLVCWPGPGGRARGEPTRDIPPSMRAEHESVLATLQGVAARPTPEGAAAQRVIDVLKPHMATEEQFILPSLTLLPVLATGKVTPDMGWAVALADRLEAEQREVLQMHEGLSDAFVGLLAAAEEAHDEATVGFAKDLAAGDLADREVTEPTTILIGEFVRARLSAH